MTYLIQSNFCPAYGISEDGIIKSANRIEEYNDRKERLETLITILASNLHKVTVELGITEVHDHKGELNVLWHCEESFLKYCQIVEIIWQAQGELWVNHFLHSSKNLIRPTLNGEVQ